MQNLDDEKKVFNRLSTNNLKVHLDKEIYIDLYKKVGISIPVGKNKLLEIGCSEGNHCAALYQLGYQVYGIDISKAAISKAKKLYPKINFQLMKAQALNFPNNYFNTTLFWLTLHHFYYSDIEKVLKEASRVTKNNGQIVICEPNNFYLYNFLAYKTAHILKTKFNIKYIDDNFTINEHSLNPFNIIELMTKNAKLESLKFFDYHSLIANLEDCPRPKHIKIIRDISNSISKRLPQKFKYDQFCLIFRVIKNYG